MALDYATLEFLRQNHPAWRLLCAHYAPLVAGFLHRAFIATNRRNLPQAELIEALEDELFALREQLGAEVFPGNALKYLNEWAERDKGWLRKFYPSGSDEPHFDLTPATEKALTWLVGLTERSFVGTESRLLTLFELLRQMSEGSQQDPKTRLDELHARREALDAEIARVQDGDMTPLDDTAIKDRFQQFQQLARELPADFREVEHNFRMLDRKVRERITLWEGAKGALLEEIMGDRDAIADSDQGKSFRAFWDFLLSQTRQEEFSRLLEHVLSLPAVQASLPEPRLMRMHYDWLEAGEHTQRTVSKLSEQIRRFIDDKAWLENRRIMDILHGIENNAMALHKSPPYELLMPLDETGATIELPLERPLFRPAFKPFIADAVPDAGDAAVDSSALYTQTVVNREELIRNIRLELQEYSQISLTEILARHPLSHGLAELLGYVQVVEDRFRLVVDDTVEDQVCWQSESGTKRRATLPRILVLRD